MGRFMVWWRQPDHFDRLSSQLQARGMATFTRATISVIAGVLAVDAAALIWTPSGPRGPVGLTCTLAGAAGAAGGALLWALRWPARAEAIRFAAASSICIALTALAQRDPLVSMLAATVLATSASYIAVFHTPPLMAYNFSVAAAVGGVAAVGIAQKLNIVAALCGYSLMLLLNLTVPFGVQVVVHMLNTDAMRAERDPLTGLLNRHAFQRRAKARLEQGRGQVAHFVITVIDLDRFKQLNDNYGHNTGDDALTSVAGALRDTSDDAAVICRSGGEEFVIADIWHPDEVSRRAQELCAVIAALPFGITASIGTASVHPAHPRGDSAELLIELIAAADAAMYVAKRRGGNQAGHHYWPAPPPSGPDESNYRSDGISA
jgi:diguanylate cyclase (GGDEF)-like protein